MKTDHRPISPAISLSSLEAKFGIALQRKDELRALTRVRIPESYARLIEFPGDPIWRQCVPDAAELEDDGLPLDPLGEDSLENRPVLACLHKYPDRALLLVTENCPMYCRFCFRKRLTHSKHSEITPAHVKEGLAYIAAHPEIREVILSGGEPLLLSTPELDEILSTLSSISHVKWIRIHTKMPCVDPAQVTHEMADCLSRHQPLYVHVHFNHPRELTKEACASLKRLADRGLPLGSHTVLLKGVNDNVEILKELFEILVENRVRPYYLLVADPCSGTSHFRTSVGEAQELMRQLFGYVSGLMVPQLMMEGPEGKGKVPAGPTYISEHSPSVRYSSYDGTSLVYPE